MATDRTQGGVGEPAIGAEVVALSDSVDVQTVTRGLYVGGGGDVRVMMLGGQVVTFANVPSGTVLPIRVRRVMLNGTSANYLLGLY